MIMLYHGSNQEIGEIDLQLGLPDKDFGRGFYLTHLRKQAERFGAELVPMSMMRRKLGDRNCASKYSTSPPRPGHNS